MLNGKALKLAQEMHKEDDSKDLSQCMTEAWKIIKDERKPFTGVAKVRRIDSISGNDDASFYTFRLWEKGEKRRIYVNDYQRRNVGYIDLNHNNEVVTEFSKKSGQYQTILKFMEEYNYDNQGNQGENRTVTD